VGRYGRPKLPAAQRRDAATINVRLNQEEKTIAEERAHDAGVTVHEWARFAALERHPPARPIVPEINREIWDKTEDSLTVLTRAIWRFQPGMEEVLRLSLESVRDDLAEVRNLLLGVEK
jgi:hypothetical protein